MEDTEVDELFGQNPTVHRPRCNTNTDPMEDLIHELLSESDGNHGLCTHVHTCNYPSSGPDNSHTHTCFHVHTNTKLVTPNADSDNGGDHSAASESTEAKSRRKRPVKMKEEGNREAVRKYREKKKARFASLEDDILRLRAVNQHLLQRLKGHAALEAEVARLKCLLVDLRARIQGEISSFPTYQSSCALDVANPCI